MNSALSFQPWSATTTEARVGLLSPALPMPELSFHLTEGDLHYYALAQCACTYQNHMSIPAVAVLYYSPLPSPSRFSLRVYGHDEQTRLQHQGPDYSSSIEAALLDLWATYAIPASSWQLFAHERANDFPQPPHASKYRRSRKELARALYCLRSPAWRRHDAQMPSCIQPPEAGFIPADATALTLENGELLQAIAELGERPRTDD